MDLDEIIRYWNESIGLDFKAIQYAKGNYHSFVKDVASMANAKTNDARLIIIGVKFNGTNKEFVGVSEPFIDPATFQQIIHEKVEPELDLDYYAYEFEGVKMGIIEIKNCDHQPYMIKNDFQSLNKGDIFIRKGTTQMRMNRADLDRIYAKKADSKYFNEEIEILFEPGRTVELEVKAPQNLTCPSQIEEEKIKEAIRRLEIGNSPEELDGLLDEASLQAYLRITEEYKYMTREQLELNLSTVKQDYKKYDDYYLYEKNAQKVNFHLKNSGSQYLEDALVSIYIDRQVGLQVVEKQVGNPSAALVTSFVAANSPKYPNIYLNKDGYTIKVNTGDIKHHVPITLFGIDLRISTGIELVGKTITLRFEIAAKNLKMPLETELFIKIV